MADEMKKGLKTSLSWLELASYASDPTDTDTRRRGLCFVGTTLKQWTGSAWTGISGGGATTSWDEIYDLDKILSIDEGSLTLAIAPSAAYLANDGVVITGSTALTGDCLKITNSGSGKDVSGTSDTWDITKAGVITATGLTMVDSQVITLGTGSDATIQWDTAKLDIAAAAINFDGDTTVETGHDLIITSGSFTYTAGDMTMSDGSLAITDADDANSLIVTNDSHVTSSSATSGMVEFQSTGITDGVLLNLELTEATLSGGYYLRAYDVTAGAAVFTVGENGDIVIAGSNAGSNAITCTTGDIFLSDTDASIFESENGTGTLLTLDNKAGAVGSAEAVLKVDAGGTVNAAGFGIYASFTGTAAAGATVVGVVPDAGSLGMFVNAGGVDTREALKVDADPTAYDVVLFHSDATIAEDKAVLSLTSAGTIASGSNVLRVDVTGTPASGAVYTEFDFAGVTDTNENVGVLIDATSKKVQALKINAAPLAGSTILATSTGALAADKATCELVSNVSACNADSAVLRVEQTHATGVATCAALKQDDVDKPFITFESTIGTGNAIEAKGAKTLTATHFVMVDIEGVGVRYLQAGTIAA